VTTARIITMADSHVITNVRYRNAGERPAVTKSVVCSMLLTCFSICNIYSGALQNSRHNDTVNVHEIGMTRNERHSRVWRGSHNFHRCRLNHLRPSDNIRVLPLARHRDSGDPGSGRLLRRHHYGLRGRYCRFRPDLVCRRVALHLS